MGSSVDELNAILAAYELVAGNTWPDLHPRLAGGAARRAGASEAQLRTELAAYLAETAPPKSAVRVFWKIAPRFTFGGCNDNFAKDAGVASPAELVGRDDYDAALPWRQQAAKYRRDDDAVVKSGQANLDFVERQEGKDGSTTWVRVGKAPIRTADGAVIGVLGMYETIDPALGRALFMKSVAPKKPGS